MKQNSNGFKCISVLLAMLMIAFNLSVAPAQAAVPSVMSYQGILKDSSGNYLTGTYSMVFKIYSASSGGSALWTETQSTVTATSGKFSVQLGSVTALNLDFSADYWLGIKVGADAEMTPRVRLTSSGYAYMAQNVVNGFTQAQHDTLDHMNISGVKGAYTIIAKTNFKLDSYTLASANSMGDMVVDTFNDSTGINSGASSGYQWRGSPNYDVSRISNYTNQVGSGTGTSSSNYPGNPASKGFDGVFNTYNYIWSSDGVPSAGSPQWLQYDFGSGNTKTITRYTVSNTDAYGSGYNRTRTPKDWTFLGSNDGTNWTTLDTQTGVTWACDSCTKNFDFTNSTAYRYYRIKVTANNGGPTYVEIAEMQLMTAPAGTATIISNAFTEAVAPTEAMVTADEALNTGTITYYVSRDNGTTWTQCAKDTVVNISSQPSGTQVKWKAVITNDAVLKGIAVSV